MFEDLSHSLIVCEKERVILPDRPTKCPAKLVADELRLGRSGCEERTNRVEGRIAHIVPCPSVKLIRTAANRCIDHGARRAAVLCRVVVRLNTKLAYRVWRRGNVLVRKTLV